MATPRTPLAPLVGFAASCGVGAVDGLGATGEMPRGRMEASRGGQTPLEQQRGWMMAAPLVGFVDSRGVGAVDGLGEREDAARSDGGLTGGGIQGTAQQVQLGEL